MPDRRYVDNLTIDELEQILMIRRRQQRAERIRRLGRRHLSDGEIISTLKEVNAKEPSSLPHTEDSELAVRQRHELGHQNQGGTRSRLRRLRDSVLLVVEIIALIGLVAILVASFHNLQTLNQEVALAREPLPTISPTQEPQIKLNVLPGGHLPPMRANPIPQRLSDLVQPVVPAPIPTQGPKSPTRIVIDSIGVDAPVVPGDDWEQLKKGAGHHLNSANPGERGNCFISAHNDIFGEIFRDLEKVELEDEVVVYTDETPYRYVVKAKRIVEPTAVEVMAPTSTPILTLMTCYPYRINTHRLVVIAELVN